MVVKHSIFALLILLILVGCSDQTKKIYIVGTIKNAETGEGLPDIGLKLFQEKNGKRISIESVRTDADGNFTIAKNTLRKKNLVLITEDSDMYYPVGWTNNDGQSYSDRYEFKQINLGSKTEVTYHFANRRDFYVRFINVNCTGPTDKLIYTYRSPYEIPDNWESFHTGCTIANSQGFMCEGQIDISYRVIRNGDTTYHSMTVENNNSISDPLLIEY